MIDIVICMYVNRIHKLCLFPVIIPFLGKFAWQKVVNARTKYRGIVLNDGLHHFHNWEVYNY